jgi:hypothetical protein
MHFKNWFAISTVLSLGLLAPPIVGGSISIIHATHVRVQEPYTASGANISNLGGGQAIHMPVFRSSGGKRLAAGHVSDHLGALPTWQTVQH